MPEYEVTYEKTAAVYLPNIGGETAGALTIVGPFGFGDATTLPGNCCVQVNFTGGPFPPNRTVCLFRPHLCPEGLSLSMWIKYSYPKSYSGFSNLNHANFPRHYIFSSGGNEDGTSGVALYLQGLYLVAEVVTDKHVWRVDVIATLKPTDWNNVAIRWKPANYSSTNVSLMGGLELFVSLRKYGHSVEPESIPTSLGSIDPPVARFGCHQSAGNRNLRGFFEEPISIDEFVFWDKYIRDNETLKFLGGYDPSMSKLTADSVNKILENVDLSDPKSQGVVVNFLNKLVDTPVEIQTTTGYPVVSTYDHRLTSNRTDNLTTPMMTTTRGPTTINSQELNDAKKANLQVITSILGKMTDLKSVRANQTESEFENFMKLLSVIDKTMIEGNEDIWRQIQKQINNPGAAGVVTSLAEWIFQNLRQIMISARQKDYGYAFHGMNFDILANKTLGRDFKQFPYQKFPGGPSKDIRLAENSALIPTDIFERCDNTYINTVFMQLNEYNRIAPVRVNPLDINPKMNSTLDAEVIILLANASYQSEKDARCTINKEKLKRSKIMIELAHLTQTEAKFSNRRLLFFDEKLDYTVMQRSCVLWNPSISDYGSWDPTDCGIFQTNATHTLCRCEKFGIVSLLAVSLPQQVTPKDAMWIMILKYILYGLSSICLLVFILTVWKTKSLREQFHVLRSHLAFAVLIASIATVLSDIDCMRHNRIPNIILSSLIQMFYLASGSLLWMDGWASFQAIIYGVIGGMLKSYIPLAWGIPTLFLGLTYILGSSRYGTDLSCFISVDNDLKLYYFGPLLAVGLMAVVLASIVYCNIGTAAVRNEVILLEISSISKGSTYVILYFNCVWIVGFLTFYTFDGPMPNFRSLFHILNSAMGIVIFVFMGLYSPRYMDAIKGRVEERRKFLLHHAVNTQQRIKEEKVRNKPHDSQLNLKEETEEDDSEEEPHVIRRKRIIAS